MQGVTLLHLLHTLESFFLSMPNMQKLQRWHGFFRSLESVATPQQLSKVHKYKNVS